MRSARPGFQSGLATPSPSGDLGHTSLGLFLRLGKGLMMLAAYTAGNGADLTANVSTYFATQCPFPVSHTTEWIEAKFSWLMKKKMQG